MEVACDEGVKRKYFIKGFDNDLLGSKPTPCLRDETWGTQLSPDLLLKPKEGLEWGTLRFVTGLVEGFPTTEGVFAGSHLYALASEFYALHGEAEALFGGGCAL